MTVERALELATLALLAVACTSEVEPLTPAQREAVRAYVSEVAPSPSHPLEIDFDDLPTLPVVRTKRAPHLDGKLDDPEWSFAQSTGAFVHTVHGGVAPVEANAKLLWNARYLYVAVDVRDDDLRATGTQPDSRVWEQDCVELMIGPNGDRYFEVQVSPRGVVFDTRYDARRQPRPFGHVDWSSRALTAVSRRGELDDGVADAGYSVELAIPWQAFSLDGSARPRPAARRRSGASNRIRHRFP